MILYIFFEKFDFNRVKFSKNNFLKQFYSNISLYDSN